MEAFLIKVGLKEQDPRELVKEWQKKIRAEKRAIEKQIREIEREERKVQLDIKRLAKQGNQEASVRILAKEIVHSRQAVTRLYTAQANINSVGMQMKQMAAQAQMNKILKGTAETMKAMQSLVSMPETMKTMKELAREMERAGFIQEMMDDMLADGAGEQEELDVDSEVARVIAEVTMEKLDRAPQITRRIQSKPAQEAEEEEEEEDQETSALEARLRNLS
ncbi:hypothetical protein BASA81_008685 [Batrachochytrium salamandrivorans]|nr:hypothetical protein BASA81_008685 [Batrachochytrium salamandrivorans]